jgi:DUF309 family protein family protein
VSTSPSAALPVRARNALASLLASALSGAAPPDALVAARRVLSAAPGEVLDAVAGTGARRSIEALIACGVVQPAAGSLTGQEGSIRLVRRGADFESQLAARLEAYLAVATRAPIGASLPTRVAQSRQLFAARLFFEAHEILEAAWTSAGGEERRALQGLIQAAAAWEHWQHGRRSAAARLLFKATVNLEATVEACARLGMGEVRTAADAWRCWLEAAEEARDASQPPLPFAGDDPPPRRGRSVD